ncbi:MAG: hypothetical protein A3H34_02265 [Betaproteobacteria bacterium RIFCSPLOWO2_02_FULL_67_19]|nr:MAG: hypothetical protein A3H34_02265 [Betaproteobacteria bacterium RIFCSPLOWO2_02_FULL_67_19]
MGSLRIQPQEIDYQQDAIAQERRRLRTPIVSAVLAAYVTVAALQPQQMVYFVVLAPLALIALEIAFEIADKLEGR